MLSYLSMNNNKYYVLLLIKSLKKMSFPMPTWHNKAHREDNYSEKMYTLTEEEKKHLIVALLLIIMTMQLNILQQQRMMLMLMASHFM